MSKTGTKQAITIGRSGYLLEDYRHPDGTYRVTEKTMFGIINKIAKRDGLGFGEASKHPDIELECVLAANEWMWPTFESNPEHWCQHCNLPYVEWTNDEILKEALTVALPDRTRGSIARYAKAEGLKMPEALARLIHAASVELAVRGTL